MKKQTEMLKFMRNWNEGFLKNIHLHISKQQYKQIKIIIKTKTKTLLILMKSSYPTYHNNKIQE